MAATAWCVSCRSHGSSPSNSGRARRFSRRPAPCSPPWGHRICYPLPSSVDAESEWPSASSCYGRRLHGWACSQPWIPYRLAFSGGWEQWLDSGGSIPRQLQYGWMICMGRSSSSWSDRPLRGWDGRRPCSPCRWFEYSAAVDGGRCSGLRFGRRRGLKRSVCYHGPNAYVYIFGLFQKETRDLPELRIHLESRRKFVWKL